jgi:hypothetical protein
MSEIDETGQSEADGGESAELGEATGTERAGTAPTDAEPIDAEPIDAEPIDAEPADAEPAHAEPADADPAGPASGDVAERLAELDELPVEQHVAVFDEIHRELRDQLVDGPGGTGGPPRPRP